MLSIGAMSGGQAGYYLNLAREDYYLQGGEPPGRWVGKGAEALGLVGEVAPTELYNLFDGLSPDGTRPLIQLQKHQDKALHRPGWDLTFSAPKSVSVLWSQASEETRALIQAAHFASVTTALSFLQDTAAQTRRGKNGREMQECQLAVAAFEHSTSRALDPQLHTHALVLNIGVRSDGTTGALSSLKILNWKMAAGALYRLELASRLSRELGIKTERQDSWFEVSGVFQGLVREFSKRREAIEKALAERNSASARSAAAAAIETRESKESVSRSKLFEEWRNTGLRFGWSNRDAEQLLGQIKPEVDVEALSNRAFAVATERLTQSSAHFMGRDFIRFAAEELQASGVSVGELLPRAHQYLSQSEQVVRLGVHLGEPRYTTNEILELETKLIVEAGQLHSRQGHLVDKAVVDAFIAKQEKFNVEQGKAVWAITTIEGDLSLVSGGAGSGKSTIMHVARQAWEAQGYSVQGVCISARAARELQSSSGISSTTIARWLMHQDPGYRGMTVIRRFGPDILEPARKLAARFGPDALDPIRRVSRRYGPNILEPLAAIAEKVAPDVLAPLKELDTRFGPNILQAWHSFVNAALKNRNPMAPVKKLDEKSILVVDEAGMVATREMELLIAACLKRGSKIVLAGDAQQLQPIGPGAPFLELGRRFGTTELVENVRQKEPWAKKAVMDIREGRAKEGIAEFAEQGLLHVAPSTIDAMEALIERWTADVCPQSEMLILAPTRKEVQDLNRLAQTARKSKNELEGRSVRIGSDEFFLNDRIMFTKNRSSLGVDNGSRGTIVEISRGGREVKVKLDSGERVTFAPREYVHVSLGYASTTHKAQGATALKSYVLVGGPMQDQELSYVELSRAERQTHLFASKESVGDDLARLSLDMSRSRQKEMAISLSSSRKWSKQVPRL